MIKYNLPLFIQMNVDENGDRVSTEILNEQIKIINNTTFLSGVPDEYYRVNINNTFTEIDISEEITATNQYKVSYQTGQMWFHSSRSGETLTVTRYYSYGVIYYPSERIYTETSGNNVTQTLQDIINTAKMTWKTPVNSYLNILSTYPSPSESWAVQTLDNNKVYRYDGTAWQWIQTITKGDTGTAATISVGTVASGATAAITNSGTSSAAVFDFTLPKGDTGEQGIQGVTGTSYNAKGDWITATAYVKSSAQIDVVYYNGNSYYCKLSHTSSGSILPTNTTYWGLFALKGTDGTGIGDMLKSDFATNAKVANGYVDKAILADGATNLTGLNASVTELNYNVGVTSGIQAQINTKMNSNLKGANNGVAELDSGGKVPTSQLPSYVDDIIEGTLATFPATGETGKIYVDTATNMTYRWSGSVYVQVNSSLALGETSATAYRGDYGKIAYDHSQTSHAFAPINSPTITGTVTLPSTTSIGTVSSTEIGYLDGVTSAIQTQLGTKLPIAGGTMTGILTAQNNTSYTTKQVRNVIISTSDAVLASMGNGDIWIKI